MQARSAVPFTVELLPGFQVDGTWNVPTTLFQVDGTWNVPTTMTYVGCVKLNASHPLLLEANQHAEVSRVPTCYCLGIVRIVVPSPKSTRRYQA